MSDPATGFPAHGFDSPHKIMDSIEIIPSSDPDTHIISYGNQDMSSRIIGSIVYCVFAGVFSGIPLYFGIRGWSKLFERPFEEAGMVIAGTLLIGVGLLLYFVHEILWALFGSTFFTASKQGLEIKKCFLWFTTKKFINQKEMKYFLMHIKRVSSKSGGGFSNWYTFSIVGRKKYILDSKTCCHESVDWLSKTLSDWFSVPIESSR
jgi:hypothetical protein